MRYRQTITLGNSKQSLLYFDYVIPLNFFLETVHENYPTYYANYPSEISLQPYPLEEFLPPDFRNEKFIDHLTKASELVTYYLLLNNDAVDETKRMAVLKGLGVDISSIDKNCSASLARLGAEYNLRATPVDIDYDISTDANNNIGDPVLCLPSLDLVRTDRTSWAQIIEFRKDKKSQAQLRRLRSFAYENYKGKSRAYVEDDILRRLDDYESTIKRWQFETVRGTVNMVLTSKMLAGSFTGSFISALIGAPLPAAIAAVGGLTLEVGKVALELRKRKFELRSILEDNPLSYLVTAKTSLTPDSIAPTGSVE
jgi:hypothetical protein